MNGHTKKNPIVSQGNVVFLVLRFNVHVCTRDDPGEWAVHWETQQPTVSPLLYLARSPPHM